VLRWKFKIKILKWARHRWLTPIILATQKAEIRRMAIQSQPWANSSRDPISKTLHKIRADGVAQGVDTPVQAPVPQKNKF
jgi:hypothetical protein